MIHGTGREHRGLNWCCHQWGPQLEPELTTQRQTRGKQQVPEEKKKAFKMAIIHSLCTSIKWLIYGPCVTLTVTATDDESHNITTITNFSVNFFTLITHRPHSRSCLYYPDACPRFTQYTDSSRLSGQWRMKCAVVWWTVWSVVLVSMIMVCSLITISTSWNFMFYHAGCCSHYKFVL